MAGTTWRDPFQEKKEVYKPNPKSLDGVPDLCMLTYLGEENVLHNLNVRYKMGHCYTSTTSKVLVAVNPYERMDHNYTQEVMAKYQAAEINLEGVASEKDLPPHVFTVANAAYQNLIAKKQNQSIIVCGESGSGKTESAKYQMRFLAFTTTSSSADPKEFADAEKIGQQVLDANPILESFGNAKTLLNNNSSRFGKFTKMLFEEVKLASGAKPRRKLVGATIETYLLEKSRVVRQDKGERNFHIFYQLTTIYKDRPDLKLGPSEQFHYVHQSGVNTLDDLRFPGKAADAEWHKELTQAFETILVPKEEIDQVFKIVSGILHLGNVNFEQLKGEGSDIKNSDEVNIASEMFQVDIPGLEKRLKTRSILLPGDKLIVKPLNEPDAIFNRDSMGRNLYNGLFRWIVNRINQQSNAKEGPTVSWIGILDVFGFEIFEHNSFEQFCINFANERLQQYFNEHVLKAEQDLYKREALLWDPIDLPDNQDCIDLVTSKPYGILPILDSTCVQPKGTDAVFTANLFKAHKYHPRLRQITQHKKSDSDKQFTAMNGFIVRHYAGAVMYDCAQFLEKNADASEFDTVELFNDSKSKIGAEILRIQAGGIIEDGKRSTKRAFRSTGTVFAEQLASLMATLKQTAPYFVRCVKPNPNKRPKDFEGEYVRPQLRCGGLIEALRIIKLGFPTRCAYKRVHEIFITILKDQKPMPNLNLRDFTEAIMHVCGDASSKIAKTDYQLGLTMVFFRPGKQTYLTDILEKKPEAVTPEQRKLIRKFLVKKRWIRARGTVRGINISGRMLNEMRFKKAAISMVLVFRTVGRVLRAARDNIGVKKNEAEEERKKKDLAFQAALRAADDLKKLQAQKADMDVALKRQAEENQRNLADKDAALEKQEARMREFMEKLQDAQGKLAEANKKQLKLHENQKAKEQELQSQLIAAGAEKDRASAQARTLESQLAGKSEELSAREKGIAERQATIDSLKRDITTLKEQIDQVTESGDSAVAAKAREMKEQAEKNEEEKDRLEGEIKDKQAEITKLRADVIEGEKRLAAHREHSENREKASEEKQADYERQLTERNRLIEELRAEIEALKKRLEENKASGEAAARAAAEQLKQARQEARDEAGKLERTISDKDSEISRLQNELAVLRATAESQSKGSAEALAAEREESRERTDKQEKVIADKDGQLNTLRRDLALATGKLEAAVASQSELNSRASQQANELTEKLQELQEKNERTLRKSENRVAEAQSEGALYKDRLENAQRELKAAAQLNEDNKVSFDRQLKDKDTALGDFKAEYRKLQAKYEQVLQSSSDKAALLQEQLNARRTEARETQAKFEKEMWEKNKELGEAKSELELLRSRINAEKDRAEVDRKNWEDQLTQAKAEAASRIEKFEAEIKGKTEDLAELKSDYKTDKKEWKDKTDKYEQQTSHLEKELERRQDEVNQAAAKFTLAEKNAKQAAEESETSFSKRETKYLATIEELKAAESDLEAERNQLQQDKLKAIEDLENERQASRERDRKHREELEKRKGEVDKIEREFVSYKGDIGAANEAKQTALVGQVATLKTMLEDEKHDKEEAKKREVEYRDRLKDASSQLGEALSELKHIQTTHNTELEKLRLELETAREKHVLESQAWKDQADGYERQLIEKTSLVNELKADVTELSDREASATAALKQKSVGVKDEIRKLKNVNEELELNQKAWLERQSAYETRLAKANVDIVEAQAALAEADRKREASLSDLKTEVEVLNAQLEAERKAALERDHDFDKELKLHKERFAKELQRINATHDRDLKQRDHQGKTQEESFKYKLQYLELSQKDLKRDRKVWQDKEAANKKQMVALGSELREIKSKYQQQLDLHEAFRQHVEAKEAARNSEQSGWDIRKQALASEHALELKKSEGQQSSRIAQLEAELERVRGDLEDSRTQVNQLTEQLADYEGDSKEVEPSYSKSRKPEPKQEAKSFQPKQEDQKDSPKETFLERVRDVAEDVVEAVKPKNEEPKPEPKPEEPRPEEPEEPEEPEPEEPKQEEPAAAPAAAEEEASF